MPEYTEPGVFLKEISHGGVPIAGRETGVTAFVEEFTTGPFHKAVEVRSADDVAHTFGPSVPLSSFFDNGGRRAWVVRLHTSGRGSVRKAIAALAELDIEAFDLICVPPMSHMPAGAWDEVFEIAEALAASHYAFLIVDPPLVKGRPLAPVDLIAWLAGGSSHAALVAPRPVVNEVPVSAAGFVAGMYARMDEEHGVWKAPAGTEASLIAADSVEHVLTDDESAELNMAGIVPIRALPQYGIIVWGARTLGNADPRYINVARLGKHIETTLRTGLTWVVFEPSGQPLWSAMEHHVVSSCPASGHRGHWRDPHRMRRTSCVATAPP